MFDYRLLNIESRSPCPCSRSSVSDLHCDTGVFGSAIITQAYNTTTWSQVLICMALDFPRLSAGHVQEMDMCLSPAACCPQVGNDPSKSISHQSPLDQGNAWSRGATKVDLQHPGWNHTVAGRNTVRTFDVRAVQRRKEQTNGTTTSKQSKCEQSTCKRVQDLLTQSSRTKSRTSEKKGEKVIEA